MAIGANLACDRKGVWVVGLMTYYMTNMIHSIQETNKNQTIKSPIKLRAVPGEIACNETKQILPKAQRG